MLILMILLIFLNVLSDKDEFIIGLRGLNNTILSFDLDDKKIEFFHKKNIHQVGVGLVY